jgi:hypothetical protein
LGSLHEFIQLVDWREHPQILQHVKGLIQTLLPFRFGIGMLLTVMTVSDSMQKKESCKDDGERWNLFVVSHFCLGDS